MFLLTLIDLELSTKIKLYGVIVSLFVYVKIGSKTRSNNSRTAIERIVIRKILYALLMFGIVIR